MKKIICFIFLILAVSLFLMGCGSGGGGDKDTDTKTTTVSGTVTDKNGTPVQNAEVTITSTPVNVTTDTNGNFSATIEVGNHHISIKVGSEEIYSKDFNCTEDPYSFSTIPTEYDPNATYPDADGDGHSSNLDCDDSNANVNPGATETCSNNTDDDCDGNADCSDSDCNNDAVCTGTSDDVQTVAKPGDLCSTDADCGGDFRCLNSLVYPGPEDAKYCAPPCSINSECSILQNNSWSFPLAANISGSENTYNTDRLFRGMGCYDLVGALHVGEDKGDGAKYCIFNCPEFSAMEFTSNGQFSNCKALPNYKPNKLGMFQGPDYEVSIYEFIWQTEVECSLLKPCPANNDVCAGDNECIVGKTLEGTCYSFKSGDLIEDCLLQCSFDCNSDCLGDCYSGGTGVDVCADKCCKSDNPICN